MLAPPASAHDGHRHPADPPTAQPAAAAKPEFRALIFSETAGLSTIPSPKRSDVECARGGERLRGGPGDGIRPYFTDAVLAEFDVIVLAQASGDFWNAAEEAAFEKFVRDGGGVVAMHNPIDSERGNAFYRDLIGTKFTAHSAANTPAPSMSSTTNIRPPPTCPTASTGMRSGTASPNQSAETSMCTRSSIP